MGLGVLSGSGSLQGGLTATRGEPRASLATWSVYCRLKLIRNAGSQNF